MARADAFIATRNMSTVVGGFFKDVAGEVGLEKAVALYVRQGERLGADLGKALKSRARRGPVSMKTLAALLAQAYQAEGLRCTIRTAPASVTVTALDCPIYAGFKAAGLDHKTIGFLCRAMSAQEFAGLSKACPQVTGSLRFRSAPRRTCVEKFVLTK